MKAIQINATNVSISLVYCFFGILSFFVLKIATKYFMGQRQVNSQMNKKQNKNFLSKHFQQLNFTKIFLKAYLLKNTLIGSIINQDKKYLLKQIFILSVIAVSCFKINTYIIWPWALGFGLYVITFILSQIVIPMFKNVQNVNLINDNSQIVSNSHQQSIIGSNEIQINSHISLAISGQRQLTLNKNQHKQKQDFNSSEYLQIQLLFITLLALFSQILICQCIVTLSLSVSNSGVLNVISFGIAILIDQIAVRLSIGIVSYLICFSLHKSQIINLFANNIFSTFCYEVLIKDLNKVYTQAKIAQTAHKIANINNPQIINQDDTCFKMKVQNHFEYVDEKIQNQILAPISQSLKEQALLEEKQQKPEIYKQSLSDNQVNAKFMENIQKQVQEVEVLKQEVKIIEDEVDYFQLFSNDIQIFTQVANDVHQQNKKPSKIKKRPIKQQQKFKSDPHLYFPYQEHKLSHKNSIHHQFQSVGFQFETSRQKSSIQDNYLTNIEVLECMDDSIITQEEPQIGTVLNDKNLNLKTLTLNQKAIIPPTSRPNHSATKRSNSKETVNIKKIKKVSPYLVDLQSQAIKPQKIRKLQVGKINKENAYQVNQSFMPSETIQFSQITHKQVKNIEKRNHQNQFFAHR